MGYPHATIEVPGDHPKIADEISRVVIQTAGADELLDGLRGGDCESGHVCATAWVFNRDVSQVLLVNHDAIGWSNPGGHVELNETTASAAARELLEETGLTCKPAGNAPMIVHPGASNRPHSHVHWNVAWVFFAATDADLKCENNREVKWFDVNDLPRGASDLAAITLAIRNQITSF